MKQFYDPFKKNLVFVNNKANNLFWDSHWDRYDIKQMIRSAVLNRMILVPTRKYLPAGSCILEGGCGLGQNVWSLFQAGYDVYGVDYAGETVEKVNDAVPELNVSIGDVRQLKFKDDFFDGYWSLGVIEHFYDGFDNIASEMKRVIKPGGYLFLTFPFMSKFRKRKVKLGKYDIWKETPELKNSFYQFALPQASVENKFTSIGFQLVDKKPVGGLKGFKDEIEHKALKRFLQQMYDSNNIIARVLAWGADQCLAPYSGHGLMMVFRNINE